LLSQNRRALNGIMEDLGTFPSRILLERSVHPAPVRAGEPEGGTT